MSTSSTTSSTSSDSTGYQLTSLTGSSTLQITGLASGLDTNSIVEELMAVKQVPLTNLQNQQSSIEAQDTALTAIQAALQTVASDVQALMNPSLYHNSQAVTSSNSAMVSTSGTSAGAGIGGYEVEVTQLANSAQRTFSFASPTVADTMTIDGQSLTVKAGESLSSLVSAINSDDDLDVYAASTTSGQLVLSNRSTGDTGSNFIQVSDTGGAVSEITSKAKEGQNALYSVDGVSSSSASNTVDDAIPGVTLTLTGITGSAPVTINVAKPAPNASTIEAAMNQFVSDYNTAVGDIEKQLSTAPSGTNSTTGTLYEDSDLSNLLSTMRQAMYSTVSTGDSSMNNLLDLGLSTGATTGSGTVSQSALNGDLTFNAAAFESALSSDPTGVQSLLTTFSNNFATTVSNEAALGGTISQRLSGNQSQVSNLTQQIADMQASLSDQQTQLTQQFADMEEALSENQSTASWLTSQIAQLP